MNSITIDELRSLIKELKEEIDGAALLVKPKKEEQEATSEEEDTAV